MQENVIFPIVGGLKPIDGPRAWSDYSQLPML